MPLSKFKINNKLRKNKIIKDTKYFNSLLIILIFFVYIQEFNIFKNFLYLVSKNYNQRAIKAYEKTFFSGFCEKSSHGYLFYIKDKYSNLFNKNEIPTIINNFNGRKPYWIFNNDGEKTSKKQLIILNKKNEIDQMKYKIIDEYNNKCFFVEKND